MILVVSLIFFMVFYVPMLGGQADTNRTARDYSVVPARSMNNLFNGITLPQNPRLAENNWNGAHQDGYNSESVGLSGPNGKKLKMIKQYNPYGFIPIMACNRHSQIMGISLSVKDMKYRLIVFNDSLEILSSTETADYIPGTFGGGYFYLDKNDNAIVIGNNKIKCMPTEYVEPKPDIYPLSPIWQSDNIVELVTGETNNSLYSVSSLWSDSLDDYYWGILSGKINSVDGSIQANAYIVMLKIDNTEASLGNCETRIIDFLELPNQYINNVSAQDENGFFYCVTNGFPQTGFLYSFYYDAKEELIKTKWKTPYENSGLLKPGTRNVGSGTSPSVMKTDNGENYVVIADNADPYTNVMIVDCEDGSVVSKVPVFSKKRGACEASMIAVNGFVGVENNYGHVWERGFPQLTPNEPGLTMIQFKSRENESSTEILWEDKRTEFFGMSMLCRESGVIYAYTGEWNDSISAVLGGVFYITAIDSWDGRVIWKIPVGRGYSNTHHYGGIYFDRRGSLYVGATDYLVSIKNVTETWIDDNKRDEEHEKRLLYNYPNPFQKATRIRYELRKRAKVQLIVYDILGRKRKTIVNEVESPGIKTVMWNSEGLGAGVYFIHLQAGTDKRIRKCLAR